MGGAQALLAVVASALAGFILGKQKGVHVAERGAGDATFFTATPGAGGFCKAKVLNNRMKGRRFRWVRHGSCRPSAGRFEIRPKAGYESPLVPPIPGGVDEIEADVRAGVPAGTIYRYSLWEVHDGGQERELDDPELEIGQI
jgi:hypothetical protein